MILSYLKEDPFIMETSQKEQNVSPHILYKGYCVDLIEKLQSRLGFTYTLQLVADGNYGSKVKVNGTNQWNGIVGELMRGVRCD